MFSLFRVQSNARGTLMISLPDYVSNQWLTVKGDYASYELALAAFGQWLDDLLTGKLQRRKS